MGIEKRIGTFVVCEPGCDESDPYTLPLNVRLSVVRRFIADEFPYRLTAYIRLSVVRRFIADEFAPCMAHVRDESQDYR